MKFIPPIQFPVYILGEKQIAFVKEQIGSSDQFVLLIRFTDGFEDVFYLDEDGDVFGTSERSIPYEQSLRRDIGIIIGLDPKRFYHILEEPVDDKITNVWIIQLDAAQGKPGFGIYFNNSYRFELIRENKKWLAVTRSRLPLPVNKLIAKRVIQLLDNWLELCNELRSENY
jgi:hypothetical protein